jgi:pilus assembly protein FimV
MARRLSSFITCALLAGAAGSAGAAELGDARVASYIGQPLVADIELTMLDNPAGAVEARLAQPNVYRGGGLGMPHVLSTLTMSVMRRDGRQFLHVTSLAPVESSRLHLYLELFDGGQRNVRLVTLSLAPDPNPAPRPAPVIPVPVPVASAVEPQPVKAAQAPAPVRPKSAPRPVVAKAPKPDPRPEPAPEPKAAPKVEPKPEPKSEPRAAAPALPIAAPPAAATCAPTAPGQPSACAALDVKNAQLRQQIGALEDKVRVLQVAMGARPSEVLGTKPAVPKAHPIRKKPEPAPEPQSATPWGWIGAGAAALLALAGAVVVVLRRRAKTPALRPVGEPRIPMMDRLRQRFARKKAAPAAVEPQLEEGAHDLSTQDR